MNGKVSFHYELLKRADLSSISCLFIQHLKQTSNASYIRLYMPPFRLKRTMGYLINRFSATANAHPHILVVLPSTIETILL